MPGSGHRSPGPARPTGAPVAEPAVRRFRAHLRTSACTSAYASVRTHKDRSVPEPWNETAVLAVSMDIRTDQGHLGKVS